MKDNEQQGKKRKRKELSQQWMSIMKGKRAKGKTRRKKKRREIRKQHVAQDGGEIKKILAIFYII